MARAMWKGAIQFGLVTIPIKLYLATESKGISFNMLHKEDLSRIQMKVWCPVEDEPISRGDTVKGYEYAPGEYVVITDEDLENVPLKTVRSIEIEQFTKAERDDAAVRFVKSAYYVEPDKVGRKAFHLLKSVLEDDGLTAICKVVIKDREALAALDPIGETMLLTTLHWPDEIRSVADLDLGEEKYDFKPAELAMARQLVSAMTGEFDPSQYKDEYRQALETIIEDKVAGKETVAVEEPEESGKLIDLMAALEASVNAAKASREANAGKPVSVSEAKEAKEAKAAKAAQGRGEGGRAQDRGRGRSRGRGARQACTEAQDRLRITPDFRPAQEPGRASNHAPSPDRSALALDARSRHDGGSMPLSRRFLASDARFEQIRRHRRARRRCMHLAQSDGAESRRRSMRRSPSERGAAESVAGLARRPRARHRREPTPERGADQCARSPGPCVPDPPGTVSRPTSRLVDPRREHAAVDREVLAADPARRG